MPRFNSLRTRGGVSFRRQVYAVISICAVLSLSSLSVGLSDAIAMERPLDAQDTYQIDGPSRILLGIFTTASEKDFDHRRLIRKTYLAAIETLGQLGLNPAGNVDRMCPLNDILEKNQDSRSCNLLYTFVIGGIDKKNTTAPTLMLGDGDRLVMPSAISNATEQDVTRLAIRENMNQGKSLTWFKYASSFSGLNIDLIGKIDTDTVFYPFGFLKELKAAFDQQGINRPATRVYGGIREVGKVPYMQGGFYFLSSDLAQYITSEDFPRQIVVDQEMKTYGYRAEDREIGSFLAIFEQEKPVRRIQLSNYVTAFHHSRFKEASNFRVRWKDSMAKEVAQRRYEDVASRYNDMCSLSSATISEELKWFDHWDNQKHAKKEFKKLLDC